jgi:hypothetical protein
MRATLKWITSLALTMVFLTAGQLYAGDRIPGAAAGKLTPVKPLVATTLIKSCCIAGTYKGKHVELPSATCKPGKNATVAFTMVIEQVKCGSSFTGTITDADGGVMSMRGTVSASGKCCLIKGEARKVSSPTHASNPMGLKTDRERVRFQGTLCQSGGKWVCKDGTSIKLESKCKGTFTMSQI